MFGSTRPRPPTFGSIDPNKTVFKASLRDGLGVHLHPYGPPTHPKSNAHSSCKRDIRDICIGIRQIIPTSTRRHISLQNCPWMVGSTPTRIFFTEGLKMYLPEAGFPWLKTNWVENGFLQEFQEKITQKLKLLSDLALALMTKKVGNGFLSPSDLFLFCFTLCAQTANFTDFPLILWITLWKLSNMGQNYENANAFFSFFWMC